MSCVLFHLPLPTVNALHKIPVSAWERGPVAQSCILQARNLTYWCPQDAQHGHLETTHTFIDSLSHLWHVWGTYGLPAVVTRSGSPTSQLIAATRILSFCALQFTTAFLPPYLYTSSWHCKRNKEMQFHVPPHTLPRNVSLVEPLLGNSVTICRRKWFSRLEMTGKWNKLSW